MPRRGENIYKRKDGRWEGRYINKKESSAPLRVLRIFPLQRIFVFITMSANRIRPRLQQKKPHCCGLFCPGFVYQFFFSSAPHFTQKVLPGFTAAPHLVQKEAVCP